MSENAATGTESEDLPRKAFIWGNEDIDDRIVRHEDPCTSAEGLAMGTSAESTNGTLVLLLTVSHTKPKTSHETHCKQH